MNTYDFDKTIFYPDSSYCFYLYCLRHYPGAMVKTLPRSVVSGLRYAAGQGNTSRWIVVVNDITKALNALEASGLFE